MLEGIDRIIDLTGPRTLQAMRASVSQMYEGWYANEFSGPYNGRSFVGPALSSPTATMPAGDPAQLGATLAVWNDDPSAPGAREDAVAAGITPRLEVLAQRTWGSPDPAPDHAGFARLAAELRPR
jgi:hypothetical protein